MHLSAFPPDWSDPSTMGVAFQPIGIIHTPFQDTAGMPIQPAGARQVQGTVEVFEQYVPGLMDLQGFSYVILLYHFHHTKACRLAVTPFLDSVPHGVFATRAPCRPNPIGLSIVSLLSVDGAVLHVENVDMLDGTPLLDIKPYIPEFDEQSAARVGWLEKATGQVAATRSDDRFR